MPTDYGPVSVTFWNDLKVRAWSEDGQRLALYLLTCPQRSMEGLYHLPPGAAADDLAWQIDRFRDALRELVTTDFVDVDERARLVLVVKALKHRAKINGPASLKGALKSLDEAQGSPRLFARFLDAADQYQPTFAAAIRARYELPDGPYEGAPEGVAQDRVTKTIQTTASQEG